MLHGMKAVALTKRHEAELEAAERPAIFDGGDEDGHDCERE